MNIKNLMLIIDRRAVAMVEGESEYECVERLVQEVVRVTLIMQGVFEIDFKSDYRRKHPGVHGLQLKYPTFQAVRDQEPYSLLDVVEGVVTPELLEAFRDKFGPSVVALRFLVDSEARKVLLEQKPKKARNEIKKIPPPEPIHPRLLKRAEMERRFLEAQPRRLQDFEPEVTFENALEPFPFMNVAQVKDLARRLREESLKAAQANEAATRDFLGPPEPATAQFAFAQGLPKDKGEKVFVQPRGPRARRY